jgi:peptidoglycan/LPS O-acetylase OafA/YrhL
LVSIALFLVAAVVAAFVGVFSGHTSKQDVQVGTAVLCVAFAVFFIWARTLLPSIDPSRLSRVPTIAEHFKRTRVLSLRVVVPVVVLWIVLIDFIPLQLSKGEQSALAIGGGAVLGLLGSILMAAKLRCPRCGTNFKKERIAELGRRSFDTRGTEDIWNSCPHCGVSFDEPWQ